MNEMKPDDSLFLKLEDVSKSMWTINKRQVSSVQKALGNNATRIILIPGDIVIDTYHPYHDISRQLGLVGHNIEPEAKP